MNSLNLIGSSLRTVLLAGATALLLSACSDSSSGDDAPPSSGNAGSGSEQVPIVTPPATGSLGEQGTDKQPTPNSQLDCAP